MIPASRAAPGSPGALPCRRTSLCVSRCPPLSNLRRGPTPTACASPLTRRGVPPPTFRSVSIRRRVPAACTRCLQLPDDLLERRQPGLELLTPAVGRHLLENRCRQKLPVGAFEHRRDLLQFPLETLGGRHELRDDLRQRLAGDAV